MEPGSKIKKKKFPKSVKEMSQEMLEETLKKKKECNAKALEIVEKLCETQIDEEWFLANLQFINQTHFDDVTIERAITKVCGYPLCTKALEKIPAQQYHISTRYNKVFDITERKNFCSSCCYKSAIYVKKQLFTSPLWFRDQETIPKYKILKTLKSSMGEEVVFLPDKLKPELKDLKRISIQEAKPDEIITELEEMCSNLTIQGIHSEKENLDKNIVKVAEKFSNSQKVTQKNVKLEKLDTKNNESNNNKILKNENDLGTKKEIRKVAAKEPNDTITKIEKSIFEWFSIETVFYLYNEEKIKELLSVEASKIKEVLNSKLSIAGHSEKIDRMIKLYGLLDSDCFSNDSSKINLKPLPDYSALKEEGKTLEVKVRAFYQGQLEVKSDHKSDKKKEENERDASPIYMPLIDAHSQTALRRKIVLDKLNKLLPDIMRVFSSDYVLQMNQVRNLVATFSLSATNITFKPTEWYLVSIIVIKLLSLKDRCLEYIINEKSSQNQILLILMNYGLHEKYLDDLIIRLNASSTLLKKLTDINRHYWY